ncbi:peroxidase [Toxorhynchites rutilus septentrionalis]|uniref:peroxidase n=1 Tax=Toxorhynchites rutilus septentrionalis TaxID=329112 RepID=UPI002478C0C0|nr:peroxidase [Toxorhynchites rutilus septentrionalis]
MECPTMSVLYLTLFLGCFALFANQRAPIVASVDQQMLSRLESIGSIQHLQEAVKYGEDVIAKSERMENMIAGSRVKVTEGSISHAQIIDGHSTVGTQKQDYIARTVLKATSHIVNSYCKPQGISSYDCGLYLSTKIIPQSKLLEKCTKIVSGKSFNDEYRRLLPASYHDGIYQFRKSVTGGDLPHPRNVSSKFHASLADGRKDSLHSVALVQWTQYIEHDLAKTTVQTMHDGTDIECCTDEHNTVLPRYLHPSCKPLYIAENDPHYRHRHVTCLNYVRSALSLGDRCNLGPANQLNQATNRLDLSQLYGNHESDKAFLRTKSGGKLKSQQFDSSEYLMENIDKKLCVAHATLDSTCYVSGDSRVNVNPYVTLLHTLFLRSHNRIAKRLALDNPRWNDERLFEMARKVNIQIYRKIVRDWLQEILGAPVDIGRIGIKERRVSNEFATAAIRFYNTMMPGEISNVATSGKHSALNLDDTYYKPKDLRKREYFAHLLSSVLQQNAMSLDTSYVDGMAQLLFKTKNIGTDVLALDIQRGRDHGLSSYVNYYKLCTGQTVQSWDDLSKIIDRADLATLKSAYGSVQDVDLIVGAIAEKPARSPEAIVGPTLACIIQDQLSYSLGEDNHQHHSIDKILANYSAARFVCDTAPVAQVQQNIFRLPAVDNPLVRCAQFASLDLTPLRKEH